MYINTKVIACLDVYQAALMTRRTPKHACVHVFDLVIRRSRVQDPAAADNIFLLALGMEII
jgi:hypothetical protein